MMSQMLLVEFHYVFEISVQEIWLMLVAVVAVAIELGQRVQVYTTMCIGSSQVTLIGTELPGPTSIATSYS